MFWEKLIEIIQTMFQYEDIDQEDKKPEPLTAKLSAASLVSNTKSEPNLADEDIADNKVICCKGDEGYCCLVAKYCLGITPCGSSDECFESLTNRRPSRKRKLSDHYLSNPRGKMHKSISAESIQSINSQERSKPRPRKSPWAKFVKRH